MYLARKIEISHVYLYTFSMHYSSLPRQIIIANHMILNSVFRKKAAQFRNLQISSNSEALEVDKFNKLSSWPLNDFDEEKGSSLE